MTNNQLCNLIGSIGAGIGFIGFGLVFFGVTAAWIPAIIGLGICAFSLMNYE